METPILKTDRLILRPLTLNDADVIYKNWTSDPEVAKYMRWNLHTDINVTKEWLEIEEQGFDDDSIYTWGFVIKETGELIGSGGLVYKEELQLFELGYNIMKKCWNCGYTTEAARKIVDFAISELKQKKLFGCHAKDNPASGSVMKKLGFQYQGEGRYSSFDNTRTFTTKDYMYRSISTMKKLNENKMVIVLDELYGKVLNGVPKVSKPVKELANDYLEKNSSPEKAAKELIKYQVAKCGTSGFITGLGGIITLPVAIPANVSSVIYVQLRMIAAIAKMGGFDIQSDQVQTLAYACLTGSAIADVLKKTGIKVGEKVAIATINKIPGKILTSINQKVGFRLVTKFGTKGVVNLVKLVPIAGGIIGGVVDIGSTKIIANNAYNIFIKKQMPSSSSTVKEDIIEEEIEDLE